MLRFAGVVALLWLVFGVLAANGAAVANVFFDSIDAVSIDAVSVDPAADPVSVDPAAPLSDAERRAIGEIASASTVRVAARTCDGFQLGSGFVAAGYLVTNRHLVAGADEVKVDQPVTPVLLPVGRRSASLDLALSAPVDAPALEFAQANPVVGERVLMAGHAGGGRTLVVEGTVHLFEDGTAWGSQGPVMLIDGSTTGGFSGGPVFDRTGRVVGVLQGYSPVLDLTIAIPVEAAGAWIAGAESGPIQTCS